MGFWANLKAKRAHKSALREYEITYADWERDVEIFTKIKEAFALAAKGEDAASNLTVQKPGEFVLWTGQGQFHETGRTAGHYEGSSQGISIPVVAGIRYRVGANRGTFVSGSEIQVYKEVGEVVLTTERLMFNGMMNTKEWLFSKWNGAATTEDESDYIFHVSNRQKTSGILFQPSTGREFNRFLAQALISAEQGISAVKPVLSEVLKGLEEDKPKKPLLELTSS
ncbi:hypothetical protein EMGBS11_06700 [Actinomycetota bacterium]|nr:hypothetical protein EMGBS11_06700 [Actinomycetota bacterium]